MSLRAASKRKPEDLQGVRSSAYPARTTLPCNNQVLAPKEDRNLSSAQSGALSERPLFASELNVRLMYDRVIKRALTERAERIVTMYTVRLRF